MINLLLGTNSKKNEQDNMEDEEDVLYYEVPEYMDIAPCEMFKAEIKARREYAIFVNHEIPELEQYLNNLIQIYIPLSDENLDNGGLKIIPKSHKLGLLKHTEIIDSHFQHKRAVDFDTLDKARTRNR